MLGDYAFADSVRVNAVSFRPGAANDEVVFKDSAATGDVIIDIITAAKTTVTIEFPSAQQMKPYLDHSACTLTAGAVVIFYLK